MVLNTSQSLDRMPHSDENADLMCLTFQPQISPAVKPNRLSRLYLLRPAGSFLSTSRGRYLVGREALLLMGFPLQRLSLSQNTDRASWLTKKSCIIIALAPKSNTHKTYQNIIMYCIDIHADLTSGAAQPCRKFDVDQNCPGGDLHGFAGNGPPQVGSVCSALVLGSH